MCLKGVWGYLAWVCHTISPTRSDPRSDLWSIRLLVNFSLGLVWSNPCFLWCRVWLVVIRARRFAWFWHKGFTSIASHNRCAAECCAPSCNVEYNAMHDIPLHWVPRYFTELFVFYTKSRILQCIMTHSTLKNNALSWVEQYQYELHCSLCSIKFGNNLLCGKLECKVQILLQSSNWEDFPSFSPLSLFPGNSVTTCTV